MKRLSYLHVMLALLTLIAPVYGSDDPTKDYAYQYDPNLPKFGYDDFWADNKDYYYDYWRDDWDKPKLEAKPLYDSQVKSRAVNWAVSTYSFRGNEEVLDVGSEDGAVSALISLMVPKGRVAGLEASSERVSLSKQEYPSSYYKNLSFYHAPDLDFSTVTLLAKFDLVTSFCTFHRVPNPSYALNKIKAALASKGKLIVSYPVAANQDFLKAVKEEMKRRGWQLSSKTEGTLSLKETIATSCLFKEAGFTLEKFKEVEEKLVFGSKSELIDWIEKSLIPNWDIPQNGRKKFYTDVVDRYLSKRPKEGYVFTIKRIDLVAACST